VSLHPGATGHHARKSQYDVYTTKIDFEAGYDQAGMFVKDIENAFPAAEIRSIEIVGNSTGQGGHRISLDLAFLVRPELRSETEAAKLKTEQKKAL
jgi:hypothetical protein